MTKKSDGQKTTRDSSEGGEWESYLQQHRPTRAQGYELPRTKTYASDLWSYLHERGVLTSNRTYE